MLTIPPIELACGATAYFDDSSGIAYRCGRCGAVVGSIGMPRECFELEQAEEEKKHIWSILNKA